MNLLIFPLALLVTAALTYVAKLSLEKLKTSIQPFYRFDLSLPTSGRWSVLFFLMIIVVLTLVVLFGSLQNFPLRPA